MDRVVERDFLSLHGRDSSEDANGSPQAGFLGNSKPAVQWPSSSNMSVMQQFMLCNKVAQEENARNLPLDKNSSSKFQPVLTVDSFETNQNTAPKFAAQKCFSLDQQGFSQYPLHSYLPQSASSFNASYHLFNEATSFPGFSHHNIPVTSSSPFFNIQNAHSGFQKNVTLPKQQIYPAGVGPVTGAFAQRDVTKPTHMTDQLTIFYAGTVNVFDDVDFDKVQEIMSLASKRSNSNSNGVNLRSEAPLPTAAVVPTKETRKKTMILAPIRVLSSCSGLSSSLSGARTTIDATGSKAADPLFPSSLRDTFKTSTAAVGSDTVAPYMPKAVPQARKASLSRFLEKRKERLTNVMPYSSSKMAPDNGSGFESLHASSISSSTDINHSSSRADSWIMAHQNCSMDSGESPGA